MMKIVKVTFIFPLFRNGKAVEFDNVREALRFAHGTWTEIYDGAFDLVVKISDAPDKYWREARFREMTKENALTTLTILEILNGNN